MIPSVTQMAYRTGSRAIFDLSEMGTDALRSALREATPAAKVRDIKISAPALMDPALEQVLRKTGVQNIWVECHPQLFRGDLSAFLQRLRNLPVDYRFFPIIGDLDLLPALLTESSGIERVVLKGCEASGFVGGETTSALYAAAKKMLRSKLKPLDIFIWGGVSTPEAAAAFLATGAAGIVFESVHWLTDLVAVDDGQRRRLANLRLDSTELAGLDLQVPCRLFNKGNSFAFKELKRYESSLCGAEITEESRRSFVDRVNAGIIHPLASHFTLDEVIPLGVETAFAASFAERFGTGTEEAVQSFMGETQSLCRLAEAKKDCFANSPLAGAMGTRYPFIQGAMSCITDVPEFALRVAEAGGLPTIALGLMDAETIGRRLQRLPEVMGTHPYAVNIVSLAENPHRETHLTWIKKHKPRFVVIAGGDLSPLRELLECGIEVIYIAPDEALLQLALEAGVRYVIIEGYEAGGHVGRHSTLTLAQRVLDLKRLKPSLFKECRIVLAGGIFNRETAFIAAMLGADAIQMGTAYLACREIVATGALTPLYQRMILESPPGGTVVSGQATGLRVRSLRTPRTAAVLSLEREFAAGHQDEHSFRTKIEEMSAGSLFTAARGMDKLSEAPLNEQLCLERGQFMSGACAGLLSTVLDLPAFHRELAAGPLVLHQPFEEPIKTRTGPLPTTASHSMKPPSPGIGHGRRQAVVPGDAHERIAITGMSIVNTLGKSPEEVWAASRDMKSGITLVPPSRWDHELFYDPRPFVLDKTYCRVGAFMDFQVSRNELGIPPHDFRTMTGATRITLWLAEKAIQSSGILESGIPRERIGVIVSQNSGESAQPLIDFTIRGYVHQILPCIKKAGVNLTPDQLRGIEHELKSVRMAPDDTTLLGRLNSAAAGFICNRYGFMGPSHSVSAACATSLVALHSAIQMIRNNIIDAAVIGGGEEYLTHLHFVEFSALGALFGLSGQDRPAHETSRPFDAGRDGMVLGEGGGMIVIERESSARARGARIHAVITSMGASNNHLGMVESSSVTQEIAIRASFKGTSYGPDAVDLVECHATSTRQGDGQEVRALKSFFNSSKRTVLTSFKSQIGHTLGASGINSLIRGVMAMKAGVFPPTINYMNPDPEIEVNGSVFLISPEPLDWQCRDDRLRRFQVNAFGFGGSNYVVQVEQSRDEEAAVLVFPGGELGLAREKADTTSDLQEDPHAAEEAGGGLPGLQGVSFFRTEIEGHGCRMAVVAQSEEDALPVIERSASLIKTGIDAPRVLRSLAQQGIFIGRDDLPARPLAFVFPGQGAQYAGMGRELYESFPVIREWMDRAAAAAEFDLLELLFHDQEKNLQKTRWQQPAMFALEHAMARNLMSLGLRPVAMAGHSLGELTALCLAGVYSPEDGFRIVNKRALCMDKAADMHMDPGVMAAVDLPPDRLQEMLKGRDDVHIGNINSPNQIVLSGNTEAVRDLCKEIKETGHRATLLRVSMAFHSPIMKVIHDELATYIAAIPFHPPQIPVISNKTMAPYPSDPDEIRHILMAHLESTVHWMANVKTLHNDYGVGLFVEVGPGDVLSNLIADTLPESICIQTALPDAEGSTYRTGQAQLFVQGALQVEREPRFVSLTAFRKAAGSHPVAQSPASRPSESGHVGLSPAERIIQREINRFVMETFGHLVKPNILAALRQELNPGVQETDLSSAIKSMLGATGPVREHGEQKQVSPGKSAFPPVDRIPAISAHVVPPAPAVSSEHQDSIELLIQIIMEATGFNRDEIQPDMDLRKDLSIRSSRLPIIMDAAERQFGITIELEDFIGLRTVRDIARKISELVAGKVGDGPPPAAEGVDSVLASPGGQAAPAPAESSAHQDHIEALIQIIMEATGFNREEIQPDMDLRRDLSIRSSRLPVIMDAAERHFEITIELEDFIGLRTVRDIARKISAIVAGNEGAGLPPAAEAAAPDPVRDEILKSAADESSLKRLVFKRVPVESSASAPITLGSGETVFLLSPDKDDDIAQNAGDIFRREYGVNPFPLLCMQAESTGQEGYDILTDKGSSQIAEKISSLASVAGMVITLPEGWSKKLNDMADVSRFLRGLFLSLKTFLQSPAKKFVLLIHCSDEAETLGRLPVEGMLGMFLSAAQEYASVQFRTLEIEKDADLRATLRDVLDRGYPLVEMAHRDGRVFTSEGHTAPLHFIEPTSFALSPGDVVVMSGGATGIGAHLARSLAPFKPRLVFLGRTVLDPAGGVNITGNDSRVSEITRTLTDLHAAGIEATYHTCDVADPEAVRVVMDEVADRYGKIRGIVHGAGILRDGFLSQMTADDFSMVTDIKFLGAWNLFQAAGKAGLKFFVGLSSVAAIQGNPGQTNYAAANRMMSALLKILRRQNDAIRFKALLLPPVEGAGMAEDPDIREMLRLKGVSYIHVNELAGLFCRELFLAPDDDDWVMFMRTLPTVKTARINALPFPSPAGELAGDFASCSPGDFPMIEGISSLDMRREQLEARRTFSREKDLWIEDHTPLTFVKYPLVSAVMFAETFMEAARILYPYLQVRGVRQVRFMDMIQCPPGIPRPARISCRRVTTGLPEVLCEVSLAAREISPAGRLTDRFTPHCTGQVILAGGEGGGGFPGDGFADFTIRLDELRTGPMESKKVLQWYKDHSGLAGRYRVLESLDGAGPGVIRGRTICRQTDDFANLPKAQYQYSPYLFEAILQLAGFYTVAMQMPEQRSMIPMEIGEMRFQRKCRAGEQITLEARVQAQNEQGFSWDARGIDDQGRTIMQVTNMRMQWVSD
jgi:malonyl CoA-acyl carrier protein transacylase